MQSVFVVLIKDVACSVATKFAVIAPAVLKIAPQRQNSASKKVLACLLNLNAPAVIHNS
jgi:hypothetical protein